MLRSRLALLIVVVALGACARTRPGLTRDLLVPAAPSGDAAAYATSLARAARARDLAHSRAWLRLGHYRPTLGGGWESEADGPNFFLAPGGKENPTAELDATVRGFFAALPAGAPDTVQHPICQFPARYRFLVRELAIDESRLPHPTCAGFEKFRDMVHVQKVKLVFSSYHLNAAASAFGHTFLRLEGNAERVGVVGKKKELLDYGIDYSATVDTSNAVVYALKGLFGGFPGAFRHMPYYYKVREYSDFESRDLWEYELALTVDEQAMLVAHLWELGSTDFDYYYVTENCSYHVLGALEAAAPRLVLLDHLHVPVVPADTIKALALNPGLIVKVSYRPSLRTTFRARVARLPAEDQALVEALADDPKAPLPAGLPPARAIAVLDTAQDLVDMQHARELLASPDGEAARAKQALMERRAAILAPSEDLEIAPPWAKEPERGHASRRVSLGGGADTDGRPWVALGFRLALHDLVDPADGYPDASSLEFLPTRLRLRRDEDGGAAVLLDESLLVRVASLTPWDRFDLRTSWHFEVGAARVDDEGCSRAHGCVGAHLAIGAGAALGTEGGGVLFYVMADGLVDAAPHLQGLSDGPLRLGVGPSAGLRVRMGANAAFLVSGGWWWLPAQEPFATWRADATLRVSPAHDWGVELVAGTREAETSATLSLLKYF